MQRREALRQRLEDLLAFQPCQSGPETVMHARPKGHMRVGITGDVKRVYLRKYFGISIRRGNEPPDAVVLVQDFATHLYVLRGNTLNGFDRGIVPQALLRGLLGPSCRVIFEHFPLILMADE